MDRLLEVLAQLPDSSADVAASLRKVLAAPTLSPSRRWGCLLACAIASRSHALVDLASHEGRAAGVSEASLADARGAASLMAMTNVYYRFDPLVGCADYAKLPARLTMKRGARPAAERTDFELFALVASVIGGCGRCVRVHERKLREAGVALEVIHDAVRLAAAVHGVATALWDAESADGASTSSDSLIR